jgi:methionyl-tRNA formyltransferase
MGTPDAAVPSLRALADVFDVIAVYTRRDRPRGRGLKLVGSPVKVAAVQLGAEIVQPSSLRSEAERLRSLAPDAIAVVAYGMLLPVDVLDAPRLGCVNVHFSLLPRWRGAAPVERAILAGDERTGVTTMLMDPGLDTGPILHAEVVDIAPDETSGSLRGRLTELAGPLLVRSLRDLDAGTVTPQQQDDATATLAPKIEPAEAELDPQAPAQELERLVRAMDPSPGAFVWFRGHRLKVWKAAWEAGDGEPGTIASVDPSGMAVQTGDGRLRLFEVQAEGKRRMSAADYARGHRPSAGEPIGARV